MTLIILPILIDIANNNIAMAIHNRPIRTVECISVSINNWTNKGKLDIVKLEERYEARGPKADAPDNNKVSASKQRIKYLHLLLIYTVEPPF